MSTYHTVDGQSYAVTAGASDATITDSSGLSRTVKAGTQESFLGDGGDVTVDGPHHFTQLKGPFGNGGGGGGGGGQKITVDDYLDHTYTSLNPVQNRVLAYAIDSKQDKLTIDPAPVSGSANPVASGGVQSCLADKASLAGTNVFTGMNSFNGTVGGSGVKDYADGYAPSDTKLSSLPTDSEMSTEGATWANGLDIMRGAIPVPYQIKPTLYGISSDGVTRISVRVARGTGGDLAVPRHHYLFPGINPGYVKTKDVTGFSYFRTVNPVSYYDTDWEADKGYTKVVEFVSKAPNGYYLISNNYFAYGVSNNSEDPTDTKSVRVGTVAQSAKEWPEWFAVCKGASASFFRKFARFTYSTYKDVAAFTAIIEATQHKTTKDRIDDAAEKGEDNTFTGDNTFKGDNTFTGDNTFDYGVKLGDRHYTHYLTCGTLNRVCSDIYWGTTKLNGGGGEGYAKLDCSNVFTRGNTFAGYAKFNDKAYFCDCTQFYHGVVFNGVTTFSCRLAARGRIDFYDDINVNCGNAIYLSPRYSNYCSGTLYNRAGDLYWGTTKINGGGDVTKAGDNTFTGQNTFEAKTSFVDRADFGSVYVRNAIGFSPNPSTSSYYTLYMHNNDLYWGCTKLNGGGGGGDGYAKLDCSNVFTGENTFEGAVTFDCSATFQAASFDHHQGGKLGGSVLYNYNGDLYWGCTQLNGGGCGGGDAKLDGCNKFTGDNYFNKGLYLSEPTSIGCHKLTMDSNGHLYWGCSQLDCQGGCVGGDVYKAGDNVFTGNNAFYNAVDVHELYFGGGGHISIQPGPYLYAVADYGKDDLLYWGEDKVVLDGADNTFTGVNEFTSRAVFSGQAEFTSAASFSGTPALNAGAVLPNPGTDTRQPCTIANYGGDLYWGTCKLNSQSVTVDTYPVMGSTNPVSSGGMYPTPVLVVQGGTAQFPARLRDNGIYVLWDNDLADRSAEIVINPDTRPNEYSTAEIHIFNHTDTPVSIKWPASWHWRTPEGDYALDTEASQHVPVLKGNSCMCITVRCSVDRGTHFTPPPMTIVPFVMAEKAYEYTLSENTQQEG